MLPPDADDDSDAIRVVTPKRILAEHLQPAAERVNAGHENDEAEYCEEMISIEHPPIKEDQVKRNQE